MNPSWSTRRHGAAERHVEVGVDIESSRHDVLAGGVDRRGALELESDGGDLLTGNANVGGRFMVKTVNGSVKIRER